MRWSDSDRTRLRGALIYALRMTVAGALALWLAYLAGAKLPIWVVLTALVVTQTSVGRSLKATLDYFAGTLAGAAWGTLVAILVHHGTETQFVGVLVLALAPMALAAALDPRFTAAPVTAAIVVLVPQITHATPSASAVERIWEVSLGGATGLAVSLMLLPASAFGHARETAAQALEHMARAVKQLIEGFETGLDAAGAHRIQDGLGQKLTELAAVVEEAERERRLRATGEPETGPLVRTLLRLRHDLVLVGRAAGAALPDALRNPLRQPLAAVSSEISHHLEACAAAMRERRPAPNGAAIGTALASYDTEVEALRSAGLMRALPADDVERCFAAGFALEQMRRNTGDLDRCIDDWATKAT